MPSNSLQVMMMCLGHPDNQHTWLLPQHNLAVAAAGAAAKQEAWLSTQQVLLLLPTPACSSKCSVSSPCRLASMQQQVLSFNQASVTAACRCSILFSCHQARCQQPPALLHCRVSIGAEHAATYGLSTSRGHTVSINANNPLNWMCLQPLQSQLHLDMGPPAYRLPKCSVECVNNCCLLLNMQLCMIFTDFQRSGKTNF